MIRICFKNHAQLFSPGEDPVLNDPDLFKNHAQLFSPGEDPVLPVPHILPEVPPQDEAARHRQELHSQRYESIEEG